MNDKYAAFLVALVMACTIAGGQAQKTSCITTLACKSDECCHKDGLLSITGECVPLDNNGIIAKITGFGCTIEDKEDLSNCPCNNKMECKQQKKSESEDAKGKICQKSSDCASQECCLADENASDGQDHGHCTALGPPGDVCARLHNGSHITGISKVACKCKKGAICTDLQESEDGNLDIGTCCTRDT